MDWLWTWGGISFGYKVDDRVFTHFGLQIGRVDGEEVYASDGRYLGEIMSDNRLITHRGKAHRSPKGATSASSTSLRCGKATGPTSGSKPSPKKVCALSVSGKWESADPDVVIGPVMPRDPLATYSTTTTRPGRTGCSASS
jgi:hypothetical protein